MRSVLDILRDMRTPHDPETGEVLKGQGAAKPPPVKPQTAAQAAVAAGTRMRGRQRGRTPDAPEAPLVVTGNLHDALRGLQDFPFLKTQKHQEQHWRARREGAHPDILEFERVFLRKTAKLGIPMFALYVVRTAEEQMALFRGGTSRDSPGDGLWPHKCCAVDLIHGRKTYELSEGQWLLLGHIGHEVANAKGIKVEWGGDWKKPGQKLGWDPAHWQLADWKALSAGYPWPEALR